MTGGLTGTGGLVRLILRRDRVLLPLWVLFLAVVPVEFVSSFRALYPTAEGLRQYADLSEHNAAFTALYGRLYGASLGEMVSWRAGFVPVMVALVSLLMVIRHTRTEEEAGRRELIGSTVVGRHAGLAAALLATIAADLVVALLLALMMAGQGLGGGGALAFGLELATAGWVYAAVGALAAQLFDGAGAARGFAAGALGAGYVLGIAGDVSGQSGGGLAWLSWLTPIGWVHQIHPYGGDRWWIVVLAAGATLVLGTAAVVVSARRDVGAGILPARPGPATAAPGLRSPLGLAWRLHRGLLSGWVVGFAVLGVVLGALARSVGDMLDGNQALTDVFQRIGGRTGVIDAYLSGMLNLLGLIAAGYAIQVVLRLRYEETSGRAEPVLGTATGRLRWAGSHLLFCLLGPAAALVAGGLGMGLTHGLSDGDLAHQLPRVLAAALVQLPAVWVLGAVTVALVGLLPRAASAGWGTLAICLLFGMVGSALRLNHWVLDVSPFTHVPHLPGGPVRTLPLLALLAVAVALGVAGLAGLRRRNLPTA